MTFAEGPFGFPMPDRVAVAVDQVLKALPKDEDFRFRRALTTKGAGDVMPGERSDVSWISTETPDRQQEIVLARGMNDGQFKLNPIVTLEHDYKRPPVGKSLWRKVVKDGHLQGIRAKTQYPHRPDNLVAEEKWPPDFAFALVQSGLLTGKSIGFLPTKITKSREKDVINVIEEWILLEYACTFLPVQQEAVVQAVSKSGIEFPEDWLDLIEESYYEGKGAVPFASGVKAPEDRAWDGPGAQKRLAEWAGLNGDNPPDTAWRKYEKGFAWVDSDKPRVRASYKLPHHDIIDGRLQVVWHGVAAAMAAVHGARGGVKLDQQARVISHLARHYKQFGKEIPKGMEEKPEPEQETEPIIITQMITLKQIETYVQRQLDAIDFEKATALGVEAAFARKLGRV